MNNPVNNFILHQESQKFATNAGLVMHTKMQSVRLGKNPSGDIELIHKIENSSDELKSFFGDNSKTEVPIAGFVNGRFISRRLDRFVVDDVAHTVRVLDYKTDIDNNKFYEKYVAQLHEYMQLLKQIYPNYKISGFILWLHDWKLESIK
jgi:ATP-dependent exoDNAse (exonuclease V) beta subunit